ncbi:MAG TPA: hypothetical protein VL357_01610 [Rariglobus sp.]|nr:hypothetical protein [Rariglobus sp.]
MLLVLESQDLGGGGLSNMNSATVESTDPRLDGVVLKSGPGSIPGKEMCAMQAVAWLAGDKFCDSPKCACPVIRRFVIKCNDSWNQENRQKLVALIPQIVGSKSTPQVERARAYHFADFAIRIVLPALLKKLGHAAEGEKLLALAKITDKATAELGRQAALSVKKFLSADAYAAETPSTETPPPVASSQICALKRLKAALEIGR